MVTLSNAIPSLLTTLYWNAFPLPEKVRKEMNLIPTGACNNKVNVFQVSIPTMTTS
jgi:hypothetical protein